MVNYKLLLSRSNWSLWSTEAKFSSPVNYTLTNRDKRAVHSFGSNLKSLFSRLKSLFFQAAVLLVFRKCRKRQCLEAIFSTSMTHQGLKLTWIFRECVKNLFYKRKDKFLSNVYWEMFIILMFSYILAVATVVARLLLPLVKYHRLPKGCPKKKCFSSSHWSKLK